MAAQEASQALRWRYGGDVDEGNLGVRGREVPLLVALLAILVCFVGVCFYLRWVCHRYNENGSTTLLPSFSSSSAAATAPVDAGLDAAAIAALPVTLYQLRRRGRPAAAAGDRELDDAAAQCSICLGEFAEQGEKVKALPRCGHCFHPECVDAWLRSRPSCPLCRASLLPDATKAAGGAGSEAV
ncbi:RING-H2 finger protein ATL66 [Brachypodium distachyon]|uniref:RING-type E3 ubiquitin transferase n=1 Tax=Brachypodium distachyon TaxID=15368 RepID=I1HT20_BRADI|nr:RING-H2 finger protein ATL66 [Brachypodium distachyon]KQK10417.1 hypothetical protein BRADI_2g54020v3 [Brachypodium distachyon]|eukprot:XP_010232510.1 RING-H2 finger protein ATL66 [Brachypodium distachyon]